MTFPFLSTPANFCRKLPIPIQFSRQAYFRIHKRFFDKSLCVLVRACEHTQNTARNAVRVAVNNGFVFLLAEQSRVSQEYTVLHCTRGDVDRRHQKRHKHTVSTQYMTIPVADTARRTPCRSRYQTPHKLKECLVSQIDIFFFLTSSKRSTSTVTIRFSKFDLSTRFLEGRTYHSLLKSSVSTDEQRNLEIFLFSCHRITLHTLVLCSHFLARSEARFKLVTRHTSRRTCVTQAAGKYFVLFIASLLKCM